MPEINITKVQATIKKVNPRKEKHGDKLILACDLTMTTKIPAEVLSCLDLAGESIQQHFWNKDGVPRFPQICGLAFEHEFKHHKIKIGAKEYSDVKICKLKVNPVEGNVAFMNFTVQMRPSKSQIGILADLAEEQIEISIEALQGDLFDEAVKREEGDDAKENTEDDSEIEK